MLKFFEKLLFKHYFFIATFFCTTSITNAPITYSSPIIRHIRAARTLLTDITKGVKYTPRFSPFTLPVPYKKFVPTSVEQLQTCIQQASKNKQKISLAGAGQSQGGQISAEQAVMIDTQKLDNIINLDIAHKTVTVQAGITWAKLQKVLNTCGLAVQAMQSYADFTVGGSLSVNAHGQDFHAGTIGDTVLSCVILNAQGEFITLSATQNPELFNLVIGGYGLFGIIIEVTLKLTHNTLLKKQPYLIKTDRYFDYFLTHIKNNKQVALHSARLSIAPRTLFDTVFSVTYTVHSPQTSYQKLEAPEHILRDQLFFNALRLSTLVKIARLPLEKFVEKTEIITRNNAMHATIDHLKNSVPNTRDILQEYFIPTAHITTFLNYLKKIVIKNNINLLNATLRFVRKTDTSFLTYAPHDCFAVVLYINLGDTHESYFKAKKWTQELINYAHALNGTYYLPYQLFGSYTQLRKIYPQFDQFINYKKLYDPQELFVNQLYLTYA